MAACEKADREDHDAEKQRLGDSHVERYGVVKGIVKRGLGEERFEGKRQKCETLLAYRLEDLYTYIIRKTICIVCFKKKCIVQLHFKCLYKLAWGLGYMYQ